MTTSPTAPLRLAQAPETGRLLAAALYADPAYAFVFPDPATRADGLAQFFSMHLANHVPQRCSYVRQDTAGGVQATVTLRPPGGVHVAASSLLLGLARLALARGVGPVRRLFWVKHHYEVIEARISETQPYWHVHMMAVRPDLQGKGVGSALLGDVLATAARRPAPIVLTTHQEINVGFYRRAGFRVTEEARLAPPGAAPYTVWCMRRP